MTRRNTADHAQHVDVASMGLGQRFSGADYATAFTITAADLGTASPEQWVRTIFEGAPVQLRWVLLIGWRVVLALRLGPLRSPLHVLGWKIAGRTDDTIELAVDSVLLTAHKVWIRSDSQVSLATFIVLKRPWARLVWMIVAPVHHRIEPYLLTRAARSIV